MEKKGLKRSLKILKQKGIQISEIVTDRHPQIRFYLKEKRKDIRHTFDTWHISKGELMEHKL